MEGLYRIPGSRTHVDQLIELLRKGMSPLMRHFALKLPLYMVYVSNNNDDNTTYLSIFARHSRFSDNDSKPIICLMLLLPFITIV